jgi:hypothetical protein
VGGRRILAVGGFTLLAAVAAAGPVVAQDGPLPEIPPGVPGEFDLMPGQGLYDEFESQLGLVDPGDFGGGSTLTGPCFGMALSYDPDGELIAAAGDFNDGAPPVDLLDGGQAFTSSNPFKVHADGVVVYGGRATAPDGDGPLDHSWYIRTQGISLDAGGDPNPEGKNNNAGMVDLRDSLPIKFTGLIKVDGSITSANGLACSGGGFVQLVGPFPLFTALGGAGAALLALGGVGLLFNARPAITWKG